MLPIRSGIFDATAPPVLPSSQAESTVAKEVIMWVKTDLPVPIIRGLEVLLRMAQVLMKKPKESQESPKRVEFGTYQGKIIGNLSRREIYGDSDDSAEPARHD
jgi:hypothetical protein